MPRKSKTPRVPATSPGQPYGIAGEQIAAMETIPLPDANEAAAGAAVPTVADKQELLNPAGPSPEPNPDFTNLLQAAVDSPVPGTGAFTAPSDRPDETFQNMPSMQPQSGTQNNPTIQALELMARNLGNDPSLLEMVNQMKIRGY